MASRRKKQVNALAGAASLGLVVTGLLLLGLLCLLNRAIEGSSSSALLLIILLGLPIGIFIMRDRRRQWARQSLLIKANASIEQHMDSLVRKRAQLIRTDAYGKPLLEQWNKEVEYFVNHHIAPQLSHEEQALLATERQGITQLILMRSYSAAQTMPVFKAFSKEMSPADFEIFCAEQLRQSGWDARVTTHSRDQGVDVVAEKAGVRVVLQCKLYSVPVGNKAVQEVVAARAHERAHFGAVVTNNRYTLPAEQLASTNGVLLLHYSDLANLDTALRPYSSERASTI